MENFFSPFSNLRSIKLIQNRMKAKHIFILSVILPLLCLNASYEASAKAKSKAGESKSVYTQKPQDGYAVYFTPENFGIKNDGSSDVSDALQDAINALKRSDNFGIIFIPEGKYRITKTIYIPTAIRLIGYGEKRPEFFLAKNSPGFGEPHPDDKGGAKYMFWFTSRIVEDEGNVPDANAGTFYSALSNIDLRIEDGNPYAVALRTHFAQHSFISHCDIHIGNGKAGLFDVGNEMEDVRFFGGDYGVYTTKTSPSWQFTMLNTCFQGQRKAAVRTQEGGWVIRRMSVKDCPVAIEINADRNDKIYAEGCTFENVSTAAIILGNEDCSPNQLSVRNISCRKVPTVLLSRTKGELVSAPSATYDIKELTYGLHISEMGAVGEFKTVCEMESTKNLTPMPANDIPSGPDMSRWTNIRDLGAVGDGKTDDTEAFRKAIGQYDVIYVPQGDYVVSGTVSLKENTALIGLNPISTQIMLKESTPAFSGFGSPVALLQTPAGGRNFVSGIGLNTGGYNYRAVGAKWQAGADSYMNDVKFLGVHGTMKRPSKDGPAPRIVRLSSGISTPDVPVANLAKDKAWDNQHWSLWITNGGGGVFKDIWSASTYASSGILVSNTSTPGRMYEISVEHHVRNEVTFKNVRNWEIYALQLEEEYRESPDVQGIELQNCSDMLFANLYLFRVIWVDTPLPYMVRTWGDCSNVEFYNVHNFTQMRYTADITVHDMNKGLNVLPWEFTRLTIKGDEPSVKAAQNGRITEIADGFEFIEGITSDSKGNVYFSEQRMRRIYRWDASTGMVSLVCDFPWPVLSLACDTQDRLLVCVKYTPQPGNASESKVTELEDRKGTSFSAWGNSGFEARFYAIDPSDPENTMTVLNKVETSSLTGVQRAFYPSHRWRDEYHDFEEVSRFVPEESFVAPDGVTVVPNFYDLLRSSSLCQAEPLGSIYVSDELNHKTFRAHFGKDMKVDAFGQFSNFGEFSACTDKSGNVYVADGLIYVYDRDGVCTQTIELPHRPSAVICVGDKLIATARTSLYSIDL
jgi:sugar lactone lactonase YvrE